MPPTRQSDYDPQGQSKHFLKMRCSRTIRACDCWIVMVKNEFAGYATFTFDFSTWDARYYLHLDCIYLEEKFRGLGIGEADYEKIDGRGKEATIA